MNIPFEPSAFGVPINTHLILEYLAFFVAFRYYMYLRKKSQDPINTMNRLSIILGAVIGALIGSRLIGYLENPLIQISKENIIQVLNTKTIMGGLFGGLLGVEISKKIIGEKQSSGDLFTFPIILGIFIGRIGCFLQGINEFTYGKATSFFMGMDLGDGLKRHPIAFYELIFLLLLFGFLKWLQKVKTLENGMIFKYFMILYFGFRFLIEFLKPNTFFVIGLSTIQILCLICLLYYQTTILNLLKRAS
ncbi:prolipoprotein diacylglyceryl transferase [Subsaxibacter sp. CAU 1640]|uniref:prolipoprotein diacylglyceryl transferase family protein n=1 Tax=Subsaxibacter sp. CAU 1640 TaxID=2933271 RepID=UPI0020066D50|nr:prolipoprotein diacylglyceryl transferase family protein [Subsaxibacter sp. CAU 1640]MCK7589468.1 prolipoprotein diacylglyceryl transferase [Subsaxibacter sp. CAU 1640]